MLPFGVKNKRTCFLYSPFALSLPERMTVSYESLCFSARCLQRCCRYSYGVRGDLRTDCLSGRQASVHNVPEDLHLPCHRVVNSQGRLVPGWTEQRALLENEGVRFKANGFVDMKKSQWEFMKEQ